MKQQAPELRMRHSPKLNEHLKKWSKQLEGPLMLKLELRRLAR